MSQWERLQNVSLLDVSIHSVLYVSLSCCTLIIYFWIWTRNVCQKFLHNFPCECGYVSGNRSLPIAANSIQLENWRRHRKNWNSNLQPIKTEMFRKLFRRSLICVRWRAPVLDCDRHRVTAYHSIWYRWLAILSIKKFYLLLATVELPRSRQGQSAQKKTKHLFEWIRLWMQLKHSVFSTTNNKLKRVSVMMYEHK